ncbi:DUF1360 domain-containing protein [Kribbella sp. NPDC050281]|uniref:DUF1360 domain-containing protein n=1 Tax=Kribbella sp. NPDC050281 TaxID=3155515 RepID=UPI0033EF09E0
MSPYDDVIVTAGTHKLARLAAKDAVTSRLRMPFTRYQDTGGPSEVMEEVREDGVLRHAIGELLTCPFCLSLCIATGSASPAPSLRVSPAWWPPPSLPWRAPTSRNFFSPVCSRSQRSSRSAGL